MNTFHSNGLFGAFLVFVFIFMLIVLCDLWYRYCTRPARDKPNYTQRRTIGFHIKQLIARILLKLGKREKVNTSPSIDELQLFSDADKMPVDAVYFNTSSTSRQILLFATARRKNGLMNTIGILRIPEYSKDLLVLPVFPETTLHQNEDEQQNLQYYTVAGIKIESMIPMQEYRIEYEGKMRHENDTSKEVDVRFNVLWRTNLPTFNFTTDISRKAMSEAMALEHWNREYFNNLKSHHQSHFEQYGTIDGSVKINGKDYAIRTSGLRDHTIGAKRDWNDFHRYVLHFIYLENGNAITVGIISMPILFTRLLIGFVTKMADKMNLPIDSCSIDLNEFDVHHPPDTYEFDFVAGHDSYRVQVKCHTKTKVLMGEQLECSLFETWCDFKVNGVKGWGAVEWQYRNEISTTEL